MKDFTDKSLFSVEAKKAIITLNKKTLKQNLLILEPFQNEGENDSEHLESLSIEVNNHESNKRLINSDQNIIDYNIQQNFLSLGLNWLSDDRHFSKNVISLNNQDELVAISKVRAEGSVTIPEFSYIICASGKSAYRTRCRSYLSYDVSLVAVNNNTSKPAKYLKLTSIESFVKVDTLAINSYGEKGDCTLIASVKVYPGSKYSHDQDDFGAPNGWRLKASSPHTVNSKNSYQRTTGWTFAFEGGGGADSEGPKGEAKASISYSSSQTETIEFLDYEVINRGTSLYMACDYRFELLYNNWKDAFTGLIDIDVKPLPKLAYSKLPLNNEIMYEIDKNINDWQRINFFISHRTAFLYSYWNKYGYDVGNSAEDEGRNFNWTYFYINLNLVSF